MQTHTQKEKMWKKNEKEKFSLKDTILKTKTSHGMGEKYFPLVTIYLVKRSHLQNTGRTLTIYKSDYSIKTPERISIHDIQIANKYIQRHWASLSIETIV